MLKRAQRLAQAKERAASREARPKAATNADFSLRASPLTRALAWNVGRGQAASSMQRIAAAAVHESGLQNVNRSRLSQVVVRAASFLFCGFVFSYGLVVVNDNIRYCLGCLHGRTWQAYITHGGSPA